jgi:hypothetical protein
VGKFETKICLQSCRLEYNTVLSVKSQVDFDKIMFGNVDTQRLTYKPHGLNVHNVVLIGHHYMSI